jgi:SAM-dependent methyltransferase
MSDRLGPGDAVDFWEERYRGTTPIWSGRANRALIDILESLEDVEPGRALDLGCGEGGDAVWLAERGWAVTGVDLSPTAIARGTAAARAAGIAADRLRLIAADLEVWTDEPVYDLVTASFLQSPIEFPREAILRRAAGLVTHGGHILVIAHAGAPHWAPAEQFADVRFPSPADDLAALGLDPVRWEVVVAEVRERIATAPDGSTGPIPDSVVLAKRVRTQP